MLHHSVHQLNQTSSQAVAESAQVVFSDGHQNSDDDNGLVGQQNLFNRRNILLADALHLLLQAANQKLRHSLNLPIVVGHQEG